MPASLPLPGASVWIRQRRWIVERARVDRRVLRLDVASGARRLTFLAPFDRPVLPAHRPLRLTRVRRQQALARVAAALGTSHPFDLPRAALRASIDILAYQLEPALALLAGVRRVLVADDVGLGKTVQAGLALAELQHRRASFRALVVVPAPLIDQWICELRERFDLDPVAAQQDALDRHALEMTVGATPWQRPGIWVASPDYLKQRHVLDAIPSTPWDVIVIDEAHGVAGDSDRHGACHELAERARHVMLLTATPHSGDDGRFRRLLALGQLPREDDAVRVFRRTRAEVSDRLAPVTRWARVPLSPAASTLLDAVLGFERTVLRATSAAQRPSVQLLMSVLRKRAASTLHALDQSLERRLEWVQAQGHAYRLDWLQPALPFIEEEAHDAEERLALVCETGLSASHERTWLRRLRLLCLGALPRDPKIHHVVSLLARTGEPVVVFTEYRSSLDCLKKRLSEMRTVATLHGGLTLRERRDQLQLFLSGHASVLATTDVGGQGLNLQSRARWVINLDVPWNPARLQQRLGRVDRIGQTRRVHTTTLTLPHAVDARIVESMTLRGNRAREVMGAGRPEATSVRSLRSSPGPETMTDGAVTLCATFERRAHAMSRIIEARRVWLRCWQCTSSVEARTCVTRGAPPAGLATRDAAIVVAAFSIVDGQGAIVEQHVRLLRLPASGCRNTKIDAWAASVRSALARTMAARVARVRAPIQARAAAMISIEHAVGDVVHALDAPEETQLAMFSQQEGASFDRARQTVQSGDSALAGAVRDLGAMGQIQAGEVTILALFETPP